MPRRRRAAPWLAAAAAALAAAALAAVLLAGGDRHAPARAVRIAATATPTATARPAKPTATSTPSATPTPTPTAAPAVGDAIALGSRPNDLTVYRDSVWVATPASHDVRRVDPATRAVTTIKLDSIADPTHIEAGFGALWVDCWADAFARIDAATGGSTPEYMPTTSRTGFGFAIGDGGAWALNRQRGIVYPLNRRTGDVDGSGIKLGEPAIDAVAVGGTIYVLMKDTVLEKIDESSGEIYGNVIFDDRPVGIEREGSKLVIGFEGNRFATYDAGTLKRTPLFEMHHAWDYGEVFKDQFWVTSAGAIYRFDTRTGARVGDPLHFDSAPQAVNFDPSGRAWVGLESGALVAVDVPKT